MASTHTQQARQFVENALYFIEMQRKLDAMEGDSNLVNASSALADALHEMLCVLEADEN